MKKIVIASMAFLIFVASTDVFSASTAKTAKAYYGTPVIDAMADEVWKHTPVINDFIQSGAKIMGQETVIQPSIRILWDEKALYVLGEVKDGTVGGTAVPADDLCNNDGIEIYLDQDHAKSMAYEADDICIKIDYQGTYVNVKNAPEGVQYCVGTTPDGYLVELAIPWTRLEPASGKVVGLDIEVSDNKLGGNQRATWLIWNDETSIAWRSPSVFGNLELIMPESTRSVNDAGDKASEKEATMYRAEIDGEVNNPKSGDAGVVVCILMVLTSLTCILALCWQTTRKQAD